MTRPTITVTYVLIVLNLAAYVYTSILGGNFFVTSPHILAIFGQFNLVVMRGGYWQLFTSLFVHANLIHLLFNMLFLFIFGVRAEELFGGVKCLLIYLFSGLAGNLLTLLLGPNTISAGASGAIFGLFGACIIYLGKTRGRSVIAALVYSVYLLMISASANVNVLAHLGGLLTGLLIGYTLVRTGTS